MWEEVWQRRNRPSEEVVMERVLYTVEDGFIACYRIKEALCFRRFAEFREEWRLAAPTRWQRLRGEPVI